MAARLWVLACTMLYCLPQTMAITEFLALGPVGGGGPPHHPPQTENNSTDQPGVITDSTHPPDGPKIVKWLQLDYEPTVSSAKDVKGQFVKSKPAELGHWFDLNLTKGGGRASFQLLELTHKNQPRLNHDTIRHLVVCIPRTPAHISDTQNRTRLGSDREDS